MNEQVKKRLLWVIGDHLKSVASITSAFAVIGAAIWWLFGAQVIDAVEYAAGTDRVMEQLAVQTITIGEINETVQGLRVRVDEIAPQRVAEYDELRSKTLGSCVRGEACKYTYRVRRTDFGKTCGAPKSTRIFEDNAGLTFYPDTVGLSQPARLSGEWSVVSSNFLVPPNVAMGVGEFYLFLEYSGCETGDIEELSIPLAVDIVTTR